MKQVLIIIHLPRGSERITGLVKYLPDFGWHPIVLTGTTNIYRDLPARIVETPYRNALGFWGRLFKLSIEETDLRQRTEGFDVDSKWLPINFFLTLASRIINYPCPDKNWKPFAVRAGGELLQEEKIDAIISSSPPIISHLIARQLKARYKVAWLADLRDLWSQNHNYSYGSLRRKLDRRLELKTLSEVDALITISQPWAEKLGALHRGKPVYNIAHGFDPKEVNNPPAKLTAKFTITYTGVIYPQKQDPAKLLSALSELISEGIVNSDDVEVRFYGEKQNWLDKEIERYELSNTAKQYGIVPRQVALEKQRESQVLLLLKWEDPKERGVYTAKVFEYLAASRPILATGGSADVVDEVLSETAAGFCVPTVADIKRVLTKQYREYKLKSEVSYRGEESKINKYSYSEMVRKFSEVLDRLVRK